MLDETVAVLATKDRHRQAILLAQLFYMSERVQSVIFGAGSSLSIGNFSTPNFQTTLDAPRNARVQREPVEGFPGPKH